jgi:hypothetical protein
LCQFNTGSLASLLCLSSTFKFFFGCSNLIYVLKVTVSDVCVLNLVGCFYAILRTVGQVFCYLSVSHLFGPSFWCVSIALEVH